MGTALLEYSQILRNIAHLVNHLLLLARVHDLSSKVQVLVVLFSFPEGL